MTLNLDAYFARIGYEGPRSATLATVTRLSDLHTCTITFEALDSFLGNPVSLEPTKVFAKLVESRRGGYCFEQNLLMHDVLAQLGYSVTPLGARVIAGVAEDAPATPVTHRFTVVDLPEGRFIVDVGFGSKCPTRPISLAAGVETETPQNTFRVVPYGAGFEVQFKNNSGWGGMYRFLDQQYHLADHEMSNWYTSTFPNSKFVRNLIVTTVDETRRYNLLNRDLTTWHEFDKPETRRLETPRELEAVLVGTMKLDLPVSIQTIWEKLPQA